MLSVTYKPFVLSVYAECCYAEHRYAEWHGALIRPQISIGKTSRLVDSHINRYGADH